MINVEKLLGGMLLGRSGRSGGLGGGGGIGLGLLGVAMEAVEHYMKQESSTSPSVNHLPSGPPPPPGSVPTPPVPPPESSSVPPSSQSSRPVSSPPVVADKTSDSMLLLRAMIAAANADGIIDAEERSRILERLNRVDPTPQERDLMIRELLSPVSLDVIIGSVKTPEIAEQVYAVSLMAITIDTEAEQRYMKELAQRLSLDDATIQRICRHLGVEHPFVF